jgi:hypothetical protein
MLYNSTSVIIRSSYERSEQLCRNLILKQGIPETNLFIVHESPFSASMKKSFEIGIDQGLRWTLCVDADILLRMDSIKKMILYAEDHSNNLCEVSGMYLDKLFGSIRTGGIHLYKTSTLGMVINNIPDEGVDIRPEAYTLSRMKSLGYKQKAASILVGLHDFEQSYRDIARKAFVFSKRYTRSIGLFVAYWNSLSKEDHDYKAAIIGISNGIKYFNNVYINSGNWGWLYNEIDSALGEKDGLMLNSSNDIENIISNWRYPKDELIVFPNRKGRFNKFKGYVLALYNKMFSINYE